MRILVITIWVLLVSFSPICAQQNGIGGGGQSRGGSYSGYTLPAENHNPCTNGTYPKPAGCFQQVKPQKNNNNYYNNNGYDYNSMVNQAIGITQQLIEEQNWANKKDTISKMSVKLTNEAIFVLLEWQSNTNPYDYNRLDLINGNISLLENNFHNTTTCIEKSILRDAILYNNLRAARNKRDAFWIMSHLFGPCTGYTFSDY